VPLALLLQKFTVLRAAAAALTPWLEIVPLESTIVERARGAFLVHWFGPRLPFEGINIRAYIVNIEDLARRHHLAEQSIPKSVPGPNLTEQLLGVAGLIAGILITPGGAIAGGYAMAHIAGFSVKAVFTALGWIAFSGVLVVGLILAPLPTAVLIGGAVTAAAGGFALLGGISDSRELRSVFNLFGSLARFMNATVTWLSQLTGNRSEIRNPLLRQILDVADRLAPLLAVGLGAVAIFVRRVGPVLEPVAKMLKSLGEFASAALAAISSASGLGTRLTPLKAGGRSISRIVHDVTTIAGTQIDLVSASVLDVFADVLKSLTDLWPKIKTAFVEFWPKAEAFMVGLFVEHPFVRVLTALGTEIGIFADAWKTTPAKEDDEPSATEPLVNELEEALKAPKAALKSLPKFPDLPAPSKEPLLHTPGLAPLSLDAIKAVATSLGSKRDPATRLTLADDARAALERSLKRRSAFASEGKLLGLEAAVSQSTFAPFRALLATIVQRVALPDLADAFAALDGTLTAIDEKLYGTKAQGAPLPVRDLPRTQRLRPQIARLRLRVPGADPEEVTRFKELVVLRLASRTYDVSAMAVAAGAP
jgi:hypothetical protein